MIDATFVQKVADLSQVQEILISSTESLDQRDHKFTSKQVYEVKPEPPKQAAKIHVSTLQGFVDLITQKVDALDPAKFVILVEHHSKVSLQAKDTDEYGRRLALVEAEPVNFEKFHFGEWMGQEEFVIAVASRFSQTDDKDYVLKIASTLTDEATAIAEDNGFSQKATVKAGMALATGVVIKPQVMLAPYRTFPECQQPVSSFVFRCKKGPNGPMLMLVEADGGKWKIDAMNEVQRLLSTLEPGVEIVA